MEAPDYDELARLEPRLAELERRVRSVEDDGRASFFCSNFVWLPLDAELQTLLGVRRVAPAGASLWVHDYHLMLVPGELRARRPGARIGWFCHIPWSGPDLFSWKNFRDCCLNFRMIGYQRIKNHQQIYKCRSYFQNSWDF